MNVDAYLDRIGVAPAPPTPAALSALIAAHTRTVPFENLDPLVGTPVRLEPEALQRKLVDGGRGGYCFEHNLLLLDALRALGYDADGLLARVRWNAPPEAVTPRTHMLLRVRLDGEAWLVDVGFGGQTLDVPLRLAPGVQRPAGEAWRLVEHGETWELHAEIDGDWRPLYRFDLRPQERVDFELASWWTSTHPTSHFRSTLVAARVDAGTRFTLRNADFAIHRAGRTERETLGSVDAVIAVLRERFRIAVPADPALRDAIARLVPPGP